MLGDRNMDSLQGKTLIRKSGEEVLADTALAAADIVCYYFSAHWCPPCRMFTPVLAEFYSELKSSNKNIEVIFVSSDRTVQEMMQYMKEDHGDWIAVPFSDPLVHARWCLPCRRFTQLLAEFYNELKWRTEPFEVIFVSLDSNDEEMINYMRESHADWLSISVDRKDNLCDILRDWFGVEGIPALIILRRNGYVITMEGAMDIQVRGIEAFYSWLDGSGITLSPQTVSSLTFDDDDDRFSPF
uniref:Thioredoxin domain-containing protein n=1 Tax=Strigamia maritima TaxID=126957 RepID=T1J3B1_STRMM